MYSSIRCHGHDSDARETRQGDKAPCRDAGAPARCCLSGVRRQGIWAHAHRGHLHAAGYTRGAFYSQFDSLDELFFSLYDERALLITDQVGDAPADVDGRETIEAALDRVAATLLLDRDWLLIKTDFLMHAARNPVVAQRLLHHRGPTACGRRSNSAWRRPARSATALGTSADAARAVIAAYDGVTEQVLLDTTRQPRAIGSTSS